MMRAGESMAEDSTFEDNQLIFVSYAHENRDWIENLGLNKDPGGVESASFWIDEDRIHSGDRWNKKAQKALKRCTSVVLLISRQFLDSEAIKKHELPLIKKRYDEGSISVVFVPIGHLDTKEVGRALKIDNLHNLISIPAWETPLPQKAERRTEIRTRIVSAATEPPEVQNLRRRILPKYHLKTDLGAGPLGRVFTAYDEQLERDIAVKLLRKRKRDKHFKDSIRSVAKVTDHTYILSVYGAYLDVDPPHYVRQFVSGDTLRTLLDDTHSGEPLPLSMVGRMMSRVGAAITHAHRNKISGLNIKPSNVIVTPQANGEYFLSLNSYREQDLLQDDDWRTNQKDVLFLPPEYRSRNTLKDLDSRRSDQYRLGLVAYEMLVGSTRFAEIGEKLRDLDFEPAKWSWPPVCDLRKNCLGILAKIVDRMISTDPEERYKSVKASIRNIQTDVDVEIVRDSYRRLLSSEQRQTDFFRSFYIEFLKEFPSARGYFKGKRFADLKSDGPVPKGWQRQFQMLKEAVLLLAVFDAFNEARREPNILTRIAEAHARMGIPAVLYEGFLEVLLETVVAEDLEHNLERSDLRHAWSNVMQPGIDYMKRKTGEYELQQLKAAH
jgi:serine/threonine protein kinase